MSSGNEQEPVVIRDNRKIDPVTGEVRKPAAAEGDPSAVPDDAAALDDVASALLAERTADLQRLQAEYANYRKRADRERLEAEHIGVSRALAALIPILDDFERAIVHEDVSEQVLQILEKQHRALAMLGLERFGDEGDPFDPAIHEAVLHDESDEVAVPTATKVMRPGYRHRERLLRAAMVGVTDPSSPPSDPDTAASGDANAETQETDSESAS